MDTCDTRLATLILLDVDYFDLALCGPVSYFDFA